MDQRKENLIAALRAFARQRPGIEPGNYGSWRDYRAESRSVTRDLHHAETLLETIAWRDSIGADQIMEAARHSGSGRLTIAETAPAEFRLSYCTGQYFPTEYRRAVCSIAAAALRGFWRENRPAEYFIVNGDQSQKFSDWEKAREFAHTFDPVVVLIEARIDGMTPGDYLRGKARTELGRTIANSW